LEPREAEGREHGHLRPELRAPVLVAQRDVALEDLGRAPMVRRVVERQTRRGDLVRPADGRARAHQGLAHLGPATSLPQHEGPTVGQGHVATLEVQHHASVRGRRDPGDELQDPGTGGHDEPRVVQRAAVLVGCQLAPRGVDQAGPHVTLVGAQPGGQRSVGPGRDTEPRQTVESVGREARPVRVQRQGTHVLLGKRCCAQRDKPTQGERHDLSHGSRLPDGSSERSRS
jgi:hypothetical protein